MMKTCTQCKKEFDATHDWKKKCLDCFLETAPTQPKPKPSDKSDIILWSVCLKAASTVAAGNKATPKALYDYTNALYLLKKNEGELVL